MKRIFSFSMVILLIMCSVLLGSCEKASLPDSSVSSMNNSEIDPAKTTPPVVNTTPVSPEVTYIQNQPGAYEWPIELERDTWNIELSLKEITEQFIIVQIIDYDNIGYLMNDCYFVVERYEDGKWVNITNLKEEAAIRNCEYFCPNTVYDYAIAYSFNPYYVIPGIELVPGHYRMTKVLSSKSVSKEISFEFDIQ